MLTWLRNKLSGDTTLPAVIFIDIGYDCYQLCEALTQQKIAQPIAFIDEEPGSHLTKMQGAKLHYPNEILALSKKHPVQVVIKFTGLGWEPDPPTVGNLAKLKVHLLTLDPQNTLEQQLTALRAVLN